MRWSARLAAWLLAVLRPSVFQPACCWLILASLGIGNRTFSQESDSKSPVDVATNADSQSAASNDASKSDSTKSSNSTRITQYRAAELASIDQLVLVLSNATDAAGSKRQEVLVFLGRNKNRGWEKIGDEDSSEIAEHWRAVAQRVIEPYVQSGMTSDQIEKVNLAVEVSIAQFQRLYHELRTDFLDQPDQKSRMAILANDTRYDRLRQLGREGLFRENSLVAKVINSALTDPR